MNATLRKPPGEILRNFFRKSGSLIFVLVAWEILVRLNILDYRFFPAPTAVLGTLGKLTLSGELFIHTAASIQRVLIGFAVGSFFGLVLGLAMGWSPLAEQIIDPLIAVFYPIPKLALLPLILIIFGIGEMSKIAIVATAVFFTVVINTAAGVRTIEPVFLDAARNFGARRARMFLQVVIPASLPVIFTGLRLGLGIGLVVIIAAEFVASNQGLGYLIWLSWGTLATSKMYAGLIMIGIIGLVTTYALQWAGERLMPWNVGRERARPRKSEQGLTAEDIRLSKLIFQIPSLLFGYSKNYLYELPVDAPLTQPATPNDGVRFAWVDHTNVVAIHYWKGRRVVRKFQRNLNRGMLGIYALYNEQVVGYVWGAAKTSPRAISCTHQPIEVGDGFTESAEVHPEFRRRGIASHLRYTMLSRIREIGPSIGLRRICGALVVQNTPMQKLIERQGSTRTQEFIQLRLTPWIFMRWSWELNEEGRSPEQAARFSLKFKVPEVLSDPTLQTIFGRTIIASARDWQPQGEA